jgi:glycosyltransferase involved in cell wall biosynthesis
MLYWPGLQDKCGLSMDRSYQPHLSVVLPVYEESENVRKLIPELVQCLQATGQNFEIIAVDDGSKDDTLSVLRELSVQYHCHLRIARHLYNKGNGASLRTGIQAARGMVIVTMDADGQHAPEDVSKLIEHIPPYDLVIGARTSDYKGHWYRGLCQLVIPFPSS